MYANENIIRDIRIYETERNLSRCTLFLGVNKKELKYSSALRNYFKTVFTLNQIFLLVAKQYWVNIVCIGYTLHNIGIKYCFKY